MQVETDLKNIYILKLNSSSIASSTPGNNNISFPQTQFIKFEQYHHNQQNIKNDKLIQAQGHKKRLTIQINDSYDFNPSSSSVENSELNISCESELNHEQKNVHFFKKNQKQSQHHYNIGESQSPSFSNSTEIDFQKIINDNLFLMQKVKSLQIELQKMNQIYEKQINSNRSLKGENDNLRIIIKSKQQMLINEKERNSRLNQKVQKLEKQNQQSLDYQQKLKQKQIKIKQLQRKVQKTSTMYKKLQRQLGESDKKIMQLEKDLQRTFCQNQHQTINRIKQSSIRVKQASVKSKQLVSNKQNLNQNVMTNTMQMRKSLDKKKCSQSQGKKKQQNLQLQTTMRGQRTSSTTNMVSKKLLVIKKQ